MCVEICTWCCYNNHKIAVFGIILKYLHVWRVDIDDQSILLTNPRQEYWSHDSSRPILDKKPGHMIPPVQSEQEAWSHFIFFQTNTGQKPGHIFLSNRSWTRSLVTWFLLSNPRQEDWSHDSSCPNLDKKPGHMIPRSNHRQEAWSHDSSIQY